MSTIWIEPIAFAKAWLHMIVSPWWWIALFLTFCQIMYSRRLERRHFGSYIEKPIPLFFRTFLIGTLVGVFVSFVLSYWSFPFLKGEVLLLWTITAIFLLFGIRFAALPYTVGFLSILSMLLEVYPISLPGRWDHLIFALSKFHYTTWLALTGILLIVEAILIRADGSRGSFPVTMKHATKEAVNGFILRRSWPLPLLVSTTSGFLPVPILLGFSRVTLTKPIEQQKRLSSTLYLLLGISICILIFFSTYFKNCLWIAAVLTFLGHEVLYQAGKWREKQGVPIFVSNDRGLKVFAVLPNTPAMAMGVKVGDVIQKLNGKKIYTHKDLEKAVKDAAFCKLEVLDEYLDRHMMQKVLYQDDPRHLGIVGAVPIGKRTKEIS